MRRFMAIFARSSAPMPRMLRRRRRSAVLEADLFGERAAASDAPELRDRLRLSRPGSGRDGARRPRGRAGPTRWRSSTCACRRAGTDLQTIEAAVGGRSRRPGGDLLRAHRLRLVRGRGAIASLGQAAVLRKPAEPIEVLQCATALSRKWQNERLVREQMERLEQVITVRTRRIGGREPAAAAPGHSRCAHRASQSRTA